MAKLIQKNLRSFGWIIGSIILALIPAWIIGMRLYEGRSSQLPFGNGGPFIIWGILTIIIAIPLRKFMQPRENLDELLKEFKSETYNAPQFLGRFDREKGLLETTARRVNEDSINMPSWGNEKGVDYNIIRFRGELLGEDGSHLEYISVEIRALKKDWGGQIVEGDRVRIEGKFEGDGILHAEWAYNYSTGSIVGARK